MNKHESLGAVHTHTHTHNTFMEKESKNRKPMQWWNPSTRQLFSREISFIKHARKYSGRKTVNNRKFTNIMVIKNNKVNIKWMGYMVKDTVKRIKFLQDSLSFL